MDNSSMSRHDPYQQSSSNDNNHTIPTSSPSNQHLPLPTPTSTTLPLTTSNVDHINTTSQLPQPIPIPMSKPLTYNRNQNHNNNFPPMPPTSLTPPLPKLRQPSFLSQDQSQRNNQTISSVFVNPIQDSNLNQSKIQNQQFTNNSINFTSSRDQPQKRKWSQMNMNSSNTQTNTIPLPPQPIEMGSFPTSRPIQTLVNLQSLPISSSMIQTTNQSNYLDSNNIHRLSLPITHQNVLPSTKTLPIPTVQNHSNNTYRAIPDRLTSYQQRIPNESDHISHDQQQTAIPTHHSGPPIHNPNTNVYDIGKLIAADCVIIAGKVYNDKGHNICGVLNQHDKPCKRIGRCPFHGDAIPVTRHNSCNGELDNHGSAGVPPSSEIMTRMRSEAGPSTAQSIENDSSPGANIDAVPEPPKKQQYKHGWTKEEHYLFLLGLHIHGRGLWKPISDIVRSRTPTQVQSHAQKYFLRQKQKDKNKRSIHDLTINSPEMQDIASKLKSSGIIGPIPNFGLGENLHTVAGLTDNRFQRDVRHGYPPVDLSGVHQVNPGMNSTIVHRNPFADPNNLMRVSNSNNAVTSVRLAQNQNASPTTAGSMNSHSNVHQLPGGAQSRSPYHQHPSIPSPENDVIHTGAPESHVRRFVTPGSSQAHAELMNRNHLYVQNRMGIMRDAYGQHGPNTAIVGQPIFSTKQEPTQKPLDHSFTPNLTEKPGESGYDQSNKSSFYQTSNIAQSYRQSDFGHHAIMRPPTHTQSATRDNPNVGWQNIPRGSQGTHFGNGNSIKENATINAMQSVNSLPLNETFPPTTGLSGNVTQIDTNQIFFDGEQN